MTTVTRSPRITLPEITTTQLWRDEVLDITYRPLANQPDGWLVRCIGAAGKPWIDVMPHICFATELTLVD